MYIIWDNFLIIRFPHETWVKFIFRFVFSNSLCSNENNLIFWSNWVIKENDSFLLVEPCSRVTCCVEIKLQYFFRKYIFICTIYTLLMQLISAILCDTCQAMVAATHGKNLWPPVPNGAMVSDSFAYGKTKSCRQHGFYVLGLVDIFTVVSAYAES